MRRLLLVVVCVGAAMCGGSSSLASASAHRPRIGAPRANPSRPTPGKHFVVSFAIRAASGRPLASAILVFAATISGRPVPHTDSFSRGTARSEVEIPKTAAGKRLVVALTVHVGTEAATRRMQYTVRAASIPSVAVEDATASEGNGGTTVLSFPLTLSEASVTPVTVSFSTQDGTAVAPTDYLPKRGRVVFSPGETAKSITVLVNGDTIVESDETLGLILSAARGAKVVRGTAIGTILNDDVPAPATAGDYQGATRESNYVFLTVLPSRTVTEFRTNSLTLNCDSPRLYLTGALDWGDIKFPIGDDGSWVGQNDWKGSEVEGDEEFTEISWKVSGLFTSATSISGSIYLLNAVNYKGAHYVCSTTIPFTASLQP